MPDPVIRFDPAAALSPAELTSVWNRSYEAYFVPLVVSEAQLAHHLRRADIDLSRSIVGHSDGEPFGLSLAGIRGDRAWIGGFGVAVEHRRKGLASRMMAEHVMRLDLTGVAETSLEVIAENPARAVYVAAGFAERRADLTLISGTLADGSDVIGADLDAEAFARAWPQVVRGGPSTWRRDLPTLLDDLGHGAQALAIPRAGRPVAVAVIHDMGGQTTLLDAAAIDAQAARDLLAALARRRPGRTVRIVDEPLGSPLAEAMLSAGFKTGLTQVEMVRPRA